MFVSFLMPGVDRGAGPLHHWVMLAQMAHFPPDEIAFVGDAVYFDPKYIPFGETLQVGGNAFVCPDRERFSQYQIFVLEADLLLDLYDEDRSHLDVFRHLLSRPVPRLIEAIKVILDELDDRRVEAFLTWCNCPSLEQLAEAHGVRVIHNELGPLRAPLYRDTVYFDLRGVNGNSTPRIWDTAGLHEQMSGVTALSTEALRGYLVADTVRVREQFVADIGQRYALGVALQIEDDSNTIAFGDGWNALDLVYLALTRQSSDRVLVRSHPGARFPYRGGLGVPDASADSLEFLAKCDRVWSINSSVLAEAALWEVPFRAFGDAPFACLDETAMTGRDAPERQMWLTAFFLGYLVPADLLFDLEYYRWRLAKPRTLAECINRHRKVADNPQGWPALGERSSDPVETVPTRGAAEWTSTLSLQRRLRRLSDELDEARQAASESATLEQELARWRSEAEKTWDNQEWLRGRVQELMSSEAGRQAEQIDRLREFMTHELAQVHADQRAVGDEVRAVALHHAAEVELQTRIEALQFNLQSLYSRRLSLKERLIGRLKKSTKQ